MKSIKFFFLSLMVVALFTNCDKTENSAEPSTTTYLPKLTMHGDPNVTLPCDATGYDDEGLTAEEQGTEIAVETSVEGKYYGASSVSGSDIYSIVYSATNKDNIPGAAERTVVWEECNGDFVTSIGGMYTADVVRNGSITPQYQGLGPIIVKDIGNGEYAISDAIGGYYEHGRGYGFHYAAKEMVVKANDIPGNDFSWDKTIVGGDFGGVMTMTHFSVDPATKTIQMTMDWEYGYIFEVTLTQND